MWPSRWPSLLDGSGRVWIPDWKRAAASTSRHSPVNADSEGRHAIRTVSATALRPGSSTPSRWNRILIYVVGRISDTVVTNRHTNAHCPDHARTRHEVGSARDERFPPTTDSSPRRPVPPPVACPPNPTTPSSPSAHGRSRCAPRASVRSQSRSRWRARGIRSGR